MNDSDDKTLLTNKTKQTITNIKLNLQQLIITLNLQQLNITLNSQQLNITLNL